MFIIINFIIQAPMKYQTISLGCNRSNLLCNHSNSNPFMCENILFSCKSKCRISLVFIMVKQCNTWQQHFKSSGCFLSYVTKSFLTMTLSLLTYTFKLNIWNKCIWHLLLLFSTDKVAGPLKGALVVGQKLKNIAYHYIVFF